MPGVRESERRSRIGVDSPITKIASSSSSSTMRSRPGMNPSPSSVSLARSMNRCRAPLSPAIPASCPALALVVNHLLLTVW